MYKKYKVLNPCKVIFDDVFTGEKETIEFLRDQVIEGRIDEIGSKVILTLSSGLGGMVNADFFELI